jgi:hypothetical protein
MSVQFALERFQLPPLKGKLFRFASGTFQGQPLRQKGRSEAGAVKAWKDIAEWRYRSS